MTLHAADLIALAIYLAAVGGVGLWVSRGQNTSSKFFVAARSLPGWLVAFTLMGSIVGTGTFVGHPGTSYQKGLILLLPILTLPVVLVLVAWFIVPFYRRVVRMSAYEYIGHRFGLAGRVYTSFGFLAERVFDIGVTLVTTAIAVNVITGWPLVPVIVGVTAFTAAYTMAGGMKAVVWTDLVQGTILITGGLVVLMRLLFAPEAGEPFAVVGEAWRGGRLTFGSWDWSWRSLFDPGTPTAWMFVAAYAVQWGRRYATDQHLVQRYLIARNDKEASRAAFAGALICTPVFCLFIFAGACLYGFFALSGAPAPEIGDAAMPFFMSRYLPAGVLGLVVAAVFAAGMSTVSSDLNSVATVITTDYFANMYPKARDAARVLCGRITILLGGALAAYAAWWLIPTEGTAPVMERAVTITAILSCGTLGLFLLGFVTRTATRLGCYVGIGSCVVFTGWAILSGGSEPLLDVGFNYEMNPILIGLFGHVILFVVGWVASRLFGGYIPPEVEDLTVWSRRRREESAASHVPTMAQ